MRPHFAPPFCATIPPLQRAHPTPPTDAAALASKTAAEKDAKKARKALEDFVTQNPGFVADNIESARSTIEDIEEPQKQVEMLNALAKSIDVRVRIAPRAVRAHI